MSASFGSWECRNLVVVNFRPTTNIFSEDRFRSLEPHGSVHELERLERLAVLLQKL